MDYQHSEGFSAKTNGYAVGAAGSEVQVISPTGPTFIGQSIKAEARTATAAGDGTGQISAGVTMVTVTSDDANKIITLPAPVPGTHITLINGTTGYELRTSAPATIGINGGTGTNAESAISASMILELVCVSATAWIGSSYTAAGVKGVVEVAAP